MLLSLLNIKFNGKISICKTGFSHKVIETSPIRNRLEREKVAVCDAVCALGRGRYSEDFRLLGISKALKLLLLVSTLPTNIKNGISVMCTYLGI